MFATPGPFISRGSRAVPAAANGGLLLQQSGTMALLAPWLAALPGAFLLLHAASATTPWDPWLDCGTVGGCDGPPMPAPRSSATEVAKGTGWFSAAAPARQQHRAIGASFAVELDPNLRSAQPQATTYATAAATQLSRSTMSTTHCHSAPSPPPFPRTYLSSRGHMRIEVGQDISVTTAANRLARTRWSLRQSAAC